MESDSDEWLESCARYMVLGTSLGLSVLWCPHQCNGVPYCARLTGLTEKLSCAASIPWLPTPVSDSHMRHIHDSFICTSIISNPCPVPCPVDWGLLEIIRHSSCPLCGGRKGRGGEGLEQTAALSLPKDMCMYVCYPHTLLVT